MTHSSGSYLLIPFASPGDPGVGKRGRHGRRRACGGFLLSNRLVQKMPVRSLQICPNSKSTRNGGAAPGQLDDHGDHLDV